MPSEPSLSAAIGMPFEEAVGFFRAKGMELSPDGWRQIWRDANARAFTVARVTEMDVLSDIRAELDRAMNEGTTLQQFKRDLKPLLEKKGWYAPKGEKAKVEMPDGTIRKRITPWRLETIYRTNLETAYQAGRYQQMMEVAESRPYWQYRAVMDKRTRPAHAMMNAKVYHHMHPIWNTWYPPNGFNCRCYVKTLSADQVRERGLEVETRGMDVKPDEGWDYNVGEKGLGAWGPDLSGYDPGLATKFIADSLRQEDFSNFLTGRIPGERVVAMLDDDIRVPLGAETVEVVLSRETLLKNRRNHPDLSDDDYRSLPEIIHDAQLVVQDRDNAAVFLRVGERIFYAAVKTTGTKKANFITSLRHAREEEIESARKKGKVLRDRLKN